MGIGEIILLTCGIVFGLNFIFVLIEWLERSAPDWMPAALCGAILIIGIVLAILGI